MGPFDVPATGTLATEWGNGPADNPYRVNVGVTSTQLKNLSVNLSLNASDGFRGHQQSDQSRQLDRIQRRDELAVLHDRHGSAEPPQGRHRDEYYVLIWKDRSQAFRLGPVGMWARAFWARVQGREAAVISTGLFFVSDPVI